MPPLQNWDDGGDAYVKEHVAFDVTLLGGASAIPLASWTLSEMAHYLKIPVVTSAFMYLRGDKGSHALRVIRSCMEKNAYAEALQLDFFEINRPSKGQLRIRNRHSSSVSDEYLSKQSMSSDAVGLDDGSMILNSMITETATENAWEHPFSGQSHLLLKSVIDRMATGDQKHAYFNQLAIIQSSGTGKSRTLDQVALQVFTIPFNLRDELASRDYTYPPEDQAVRSYFMTSARDFDNTCTRYLVFLTVLFEEVASYLPQVELSTLAETATRWAKFLKTPSTSPSRTGTKRDELYRMVSAKATIRFTETPDYATGVENAQNARTALLALINPTKQPRVQLLLYFDEAHPLTAKFVPGTSKSH
ncbi:hypothetical protein FRB95_009332 [Tulasnella sp. JGI-2019a]|nr:hypothetical protein FRB95_009332 [Tulasnella sp. JGI-2019a]